MGVELIATVDSALEQILDAPLACALWRDDRPYRRKILTRFPYVVFFRIDGDVVEIVAVANARRRPEYWLERVRR
jgi:toxin ParE1/3/4